MPQRDGAVRGWGQHHSGQLGTGTTTASPTPEETLNLTGVKTLAAGYYHSLALLNDGSLYAFGNDDFSQIGDVSAGAFKDFIGETLRLDPITPHPLYSSDELLSFFMGKNTPERQDFIIDNLRVEKDLVEA